jgi:hypothetical protein
MQFLKQSTAASVIVGPVLDADGNPYTGAVIGDFNITKNGTTAALAAAATATHSHNGHYVIALTTGNTDTLGRLAISMNRATYGMTIFRYDVLAANQFDAIVTNGNVTPAAIADAVWDEDNRDHLLAHSTGKNLNTIRKRNLLVEGTILASPTPTTTVFNVSAVDYPTGAFKHSVLSFAEDATIANQNSPILTYVNNGNGTSTITIEEPLTSAPTAGDKVQIDANSHVHAISAIAAGIWSVAFSAYSAATGTMGLIMYAFSQMLEFVSVWRWKATSLSQAPSGGGGGDASQATLLAVKAKTDLITIQTANQQQTPVNQIAITRGDSYSGSTKITRAVTTDYTGYTATFTIRHRVTNAVLLTKAATVDSSTQLSVSLTTTDTAFTLLVDATEFGPHPYDFRLASGSIEKTEPGIAIIKRDVTT